MSEYLSCFECEDGVLHEVILPYEAVAGDGKTLTIPDVPLLVCDKCGSECLDSEAGRMIDAAREASGVKFRGRQECDDDHHAMMNRARIQQSLPEGYFQKLLEALEESKKYLD